MQHKNGGDIDAHDTVIRINHAPISVELSAIAGVRDDVRYMAGAITPVFNSLFQSHIFLYSYNYISIYLYIYIFIYLYNCTIIYLYIEDAMRRTIAAPSRLGLGDL